MSEYSRLNNMSREELLEFAKFAIVASPTLLVTHEKRIQFYKDYPDKNPHRAAACPDQLELPFL